MDPAKRFLEAPYSERIPREVGDAVRKHGILRFAQDDKLERDDKPERD